MRTKTYFSAMLGFHRFSSSEHTGYRFGFNGMEKDDEIKGNGNSIDFGARILDPRVGRFLSLDPMAKDYPSMSNYSSTGNNPIYYIDVEGKYFTGNTAIIKDLYATALMMIENDMDGGEALKSMIERMDASDIEFHVTQPANTGYDATAGESFFDFDNNRMVLEIDEMKYGTSSSVNEMGRGAHEVEHGRQFMDGEIDYVQKSDGQIGGGQAHDITDEEKSIEIQDQVHNATMWGSDKVRGAERKENQKSSYDLQNGPVNASKQMTDYYNSGKVDGIDRSASKFNYTPTEKQKSEKKSILKP